MNIVKLIQKKDLTQNVNRLYLHTWKIYFRCPRGGRSVTVSALLNHVIDGLGHGTDSTAGRQGSYVGKTGNACWKNGLTLMLNGCFNNNCTENSDPRVI